MIWPFVSRSHHERRIESYAGDLRTAIGLERQANARLDQIIEKYHELVMSIAHPSAPVLLTATDPQAAKLTLRDAEPVDAIAKTIREEAGRDTHLAQHLRKYARELKAQGLTEDEIVGKLVAWQTSEPEDHVASA